MKDGTNHPLSQPLHHLRRSGHCRNRHHLVDGPCWFLIQTSDAKPTPRLIFFPSSPLFQILAFALILHDHVSLMDVYYLSVHHLFLLGFCPPTIHYSNIPFPLDHYGTIIIHENDLRLITNFINKLLLFYRFYHSTFIFINFITQFLLFKFSFHELYIQFSIFCKFCPPIFLFLFILSWHW